MKSPIWLLRVTWRHQNILSTKVEFKSGAFFGIDVVRAAPLRQGYLHYWCDEQIMSLLCKMLLQWLKMACLKLKPNFSYIGHAAHNRHTNYVMLAFWKTMRNRYGWIQYMAEWRPIIYWCNEFFISTPCQQKKLSHNALHWRDI